MEPPPQPVFLAQARGLGMASSASTGLSRGGSHLTPIFRERNRCGRRSHRQVPGSPSCPAELRCKREKVCTILLPAEHEWVPIH